MVFWIIAAIIAIIAALLCMRIKVRVTYDGTLCIRAGTLFFSFPVYPQRKKPPNPRKFTPAAIAKRKKREERAARKKAEKKKQQTEKARRSRANGKKKPSARQLAALIRFWTRIFRITAGRFFRYLHVDVFRFRIGVATGDAASTAVAYGAVSAAAGLMFDLFDRCRRFRFRRGSRPEIYADFLSEEITAQIDITFSLRTWQALAVIITGAMAYLRGKGYPQTDLPKPPVKPNTKPTEHSNT